MFVGFGGTLKTTSVQAVKSALIKLTSEWPKVALQVSWKIEPCFMPSQHLGDPEGGLESTVQPDAPVESQIVSNTSQSELEPVSELSFSTPEVTTHSPN